MLNSTFGYHIIHFQLVSKAKVIIDCFSCMILDLFDELFQVVVCTITRSVYRLIAT